jgi:hypothetical protein
LKPEWWGSLLVQKKYQEEKACEKRHPYRIKIIITIMVITIIIINMQLSFQDIIHVIWYYGFLFAANKMKIFFMGSEN